MSNLSQFFALGGNKIKSIQTVTAQQSLNFNTYTWSGVTATITAVDTTKTLLICSPSNNSIYTYLNTLGTSGGISNTGHGAFLSSSTQISFHGPILTFAPSGFGSPTVYSNPAYMVVQVVEFE